MKNKTVIRTFEVLDLIAQYPQGIVLSEIVQSLDIPKSTIHDILQALLSIGSVYYKDERLKSYAIGPKIFALGGAYSRTSNLITVSQPYIEKLSEVINQPLLVSKLVGNDIVHVYKKEPGNVILKTAGLGVVPEGYRSTTGKVLIALSKRHFEDVKVLFDDIDEAYTDELINIRKKKYCIGLETEGKHTITICVPVYNMLNEVGGTITATGIYIPDIDYEEELRQLKDIASKISYRLGYKGSI